MKKPVTPTTPQGTGGIKNITRVFSLVITIGMIFLSMGAKAKWDAPGSDKAAGRHATEAVNKVNAPKPTGKAQGMDQGSPLSFIENKGQVYDQFRSPRHDIQYSLHAGNGLNVFIGNGAIHYQFSKAEGNNENMRFLSSPGKMHEPPHQREQEKEHQKMSMYRMDVELVGADKNAKIVTAEQQPFYENYVDKGKAQAYNRITYKNVYPNIDWVLYTSNGNLKHEFVVRAGGRVSDIKLKYGGATALTLDNKGALIAETPQGTITEATPYTFEKSGKKVASAFKLKDNVLSYETGAFNGDLVIDPTLEWATYYGGEASEGYIAPNIKTDNAGNIYISSATYSTTNIATSGAFSTTLETSMYSCFAKFSSAGACLWSTYFYGIIGDIAPDSDGNVYVVGQVYDTFSAVATSGAYQTFINGIEEGFIQKFNSSGGRVWGTFYGGTGSEYINSIAIDASNNIYVGGNTYSSSEIATTGATDETYGGAFDGFIAKFTTSGTRVWATYLGGSGAEYVRKLGTDASGNLFVLGYTESSSGIATSGTLHPSFMGGTYDGFLVKYNGAGTKQWGTYLGGSGFDLYNTLAIDESGNVYVTGQTNSTGIATTGAFQTGAASTYSSTLEKFNNSGSLLWATYFEGAGNTSIDAMAVDTGNYLYVGGTTSSLSGIASPGAPHSVYDAEINLGYIEKFDVNGMPRWGTYFGENQSQISSIAFDADNNILVAGLTNDATGIATTGAHQETIGGEDDAFIAKYTNAPCSPLPDAGTISGPSLLCAFGIVTKTIDGGEWLSSNPNIGYVDTTGEDIYLLANGTNGDVTIRYRVGNSCGWAYANEIATTVVNYNPPAAITGTPTTICIGATTALSDATAGGTWSSLNTAVATVGSTGIVTGVAIGTVNIYYTTTTSGCTWSANKVITVGAYPGGVFGAPHTCIGGTTALFKTGSAGGTWSSSTPSVATVGTSGVVTGMSEGTTTISYTVTNSCGTNSATKVVTVTIAGYAGTITGTPTLCVGGESDLDDVVSGGTWESDNTAVATVDGSGIVTAVSAGTATIYYTTEDDVCGTGWATLVVTVTVGSDPGTITGTATVCVGSNTTLSDAVSGGVWSSGTPSVATIGTTGIVAGVSAGTTTISYTVTAGCGTSSATQVVTVNTTGAGTITGSSTVCIGSTTTLSDATGGGVWSSSNSNATVGTSGMVMGVTAGNVTISYTVTDGCGSATTTKAMTVNTTTDAGTITGSSTVCVGANTTLSNATSGGVWSSSNGSIATVGTSGVVTGVLAGNATISYTVTDGCGSATAAKDVTVNTTTGAGTITGTATVCVGNTTALSDATSGGVWTSGSTGVATVGTSGIVTGVSAGNATISYTVTDGCGSATATQVVTVNTTTSAGTITGTATVCVGATTALSDATSGGVWSSGSMGVATIGTSGIVTGVSAGNATISYTVTDGCGSATATVNATVNAAPDAGTITGASSVNEGATITLSDGVSGGVWSSGATGVATVGTSGIVTGVAAGVVSISYTVTNGCGSASATKSVTVNTVALDDITGTLTVCVGSTTTLSHSITGGVWTSGNTSVASIGVSTGIVTGLSAGTATISYYVTGSYVTAVVSVNPIPAMIGGATSVCLSATTTLTDATGSGTWSSNNAAIASIDAGGIVSGVATGTTTMSYTLGTGCYRTLSMTVKPLPSAITGTASVCEGSTTTLTNSTTIGVSWISNTPSIATVGIGSGVVTGVAAGTSKITYTINTGCFITRDVTVTTAPATISGTLFACAGSTSSLSTTPSGGTWSSSNTAIATVGTSGIVTGVAGGYANITYSLSGGCRKIAAYTVGAMPAAITGSLGVCLGGTTALSSATPGCAWSSGTTSVATIGTTGVVTSVSAGTSTISYTHPLGCARSAVVTVNSSVPAVTGTFTVCVGATTTLSDGATGGTWTSSNTTKATVNASGLVTGKAAGTVNITYTIGSGCTVWTTMTINALPAAITGTMNMCNGATTTLSDATAGGTWASSNAALATVNSSGVVTGVSAGTPTITYTASGCFKTANVTVKPLPAAIVGNMAVCVGGTSTVTDPSPVGVSWTSSNASIATIGITSGMMTGVAAGNATITYLNNTGCVATRQATVSAAPSAGTISGPTTVIIANNITLSSTVTGGTWSSEDAGIASVVSTTGVVTGVSAGGPINITYTANNGCGSAFATYAVDVTTSRPGSGQMAGAGGSSLFSVYPNPTAGALTIEAPTTGMFTVYTIDGKQVSSYVIKEATTSIELPKNLAAGIYMCRFNGDDGSTTMVRLVYEQ